MVSDKNIGQLTQQVKAGNTYVALSWDDYLSMGQNMQSILAYIKEDQVLLCYERRSLKEDVCKDVPLPVDPMAQKAPAAP